MMEEDYNRIQWRFKGEKLMGKKCGRGETTSKVYVSTNTFPVIYKIEYYHKWEVRGQERTRIDVEFQDSNRGAHFEKKDLTRKNIKIRNDEGRKENINRAS